MAAERQQNWLSEQRVDVPHLRAVESAIAADFDLLAGTIMAGRAPLVVSGFKLITTGITHAQALQLQVADSSLIHFYASESGSIFHVPANQPIEILSSTNTNISGSFTPAQTNYIGLDLIRLADSTTNDLVEFMDTATLQETPKTVPLARTLTYKIVITTTDFDANPGLVPIARVKVDSNFAITEVEDARNIFWRLGQGGTVPNPLNTYSWPSGRKEGSVTSDFTGGDKTITSQKSWMDAIMTRLWELGGGEFWYSPTADHNVVMARTGSPFVSSGEYFEWSGTNLHWKGLMFTFANSTGVTNTVANVITDTAGTTDLAAGECVYVDLDRTSNATLNAVKAPLNLVGSPDVPGSRWVLAWRIGSSIYVRDQSYAVGSSFKLATTAAAGGVLLSASDSAAISPVAVASVDSILKAAYAGGITRGGDYVGGAGDIKVGGFSTSDHNVLLRTFRDQDEVSVTGSHVYTMGQAASLSVINTSDFTANLEDITARFAAWNVGSAQIEDAQHLESGGAMGFRNVLFPPQTPTPTATRPIRSKTFFRDNGIASPNKRDQFCVMWFDGTVTVIAESATY